MIIHQKPRRNQGAVPPIALAVIIAAIIFAGLYFFVIRDTAPDDLSTEDGPELAVDIAEPPPEPVEPAGPVEPEMVEVEPEEPEEPVDPVEPTDTSGLTGPPAESMAHIADAIIAEDWQGLRRMIGAEVLTGERFEKFRALFEEQDFRLRSERAVSQIGQTRVMQRWAINLTSGEDAARTGRIEFDFNRGEGADEAWRLARLYLPGENPVETLEPDADALSIADQFLQALTEQDFPAARQYVDRDKITDARLAGLCILFEEGEFTLKEDEPLVATVARDDVTWFMAQVTSPATGTDSHFGMVLHRDDEQPWRITEVNLERFLAAYARRFGHGDIYYTPIIQNPEKGDSVAVFFEFNDASIDERTMRQIEVVAIAVKDDLQRRITVEGHTDIVGDDAYNMRLSEERSQAVRDALIAFGVDESQINLDAHGATQPRRSNFLPDGSDNPEGRRVNRRVEMFLDF